MEGVEAWSRSVSTPQCLAALNAEGVPSSAYRTVKEALADPQIAHRGALAEVEDGGGTFKVLNLPFRMSGAKVSRRTAKMATLGRAHARLSEGDRPFRRRYRGILGKAGGSRAALTATCGF